MAIKAKPTHSSPMQLSVVWLLLKAPAPPAIPLRKNASGHAPCHCLCLGEENPQNQVMIYAHCSVKSIEKSVTVEKYAKLDSRWQLLVGILDMESWCIALLFHG